MPQGGFLEQRPRSPGGLAIIILIHAALITALALSKMDMPGDPGFGPFKIRNIPIQPDPPPVPPDTRQEVKVRPKSRLDTPPRVIPTPPSDDRIVLPSNDPIVFDTGKPGNDQVGTPADPPKPAADPIRVGARMAPGAVLQPEYPASEQRLGREGSVTVRVTIGADGRVRAVEKVSATSDAFYRATERHALRSWRFKPATVDGRPVESRTVLTVYFRLDG
jgi:protein TonB